MVLKNPTNGSDPTSTLAIGLIIKNMALVFNTIQMVINIKVDGKIIKDMVKVHIGLLILKIN